MVIAYEIASEMIYLDRAIALNSSINFFTLIIFNKLSAIEVDEGQIR
jgi:hypothetical protein